MRSPIASGSEQLEPVYSHDVQLLDWAQAGMEELSACPGIGPTKVRRLHDTFHEPFRRGMGPDNVASGEPITGALPLQAPAVAANMVFVD